MDLPSTDQDIGVLREQIVSLQARIAVLEDRGARKIVPPPLEPVTTVTYAPPPAPVSADLLPNGRELTALREICAREYPKWVDGDGYLAGRRGTISKEENDFEWTLQFLRAISALGHMRKLEQPKTLYK